VHCRRMVAALLSMYASRRRSAMARYTFGGGGAMCCATVRVCVRACVCTQALCASARHHHPHHTSMHPPITPPPSHVRTRAPARWRSTGMRAPAWSR
jgi:hypothetical protein